MLLKFYVSSSKCLLGVAALLRLLREIIRQLINQIITTHFVEQPQLHGVSYLSLKKFQYQL